MKILIEKELGHPVTVNGYAEVIGPFYHIYTIEEDGTRTFVETVNGDIKEAARIAERKLDFNALEIAYKENPNAFKSCL